MKRLFLICSIFLSCTTFSHAEGIYTTTFGSDTRQVTLSTNPATSTQILTFSPFTERTWIVNSSSVTVFISTFTNVNLTTSTPGVFQIPAASSGTVLNSNIPVIWSPDGVNAPYVGGGFANANAGGSQISISVFRAK